MGFGVEVGVDKVLVLLRGEIRGAMSGKKERG